MKKVITLVLLLTVLASCFVPAQAGGLDAVREWIQKTKEGTVDQPLETVPPETEENPGSPEPMQEINPWQNVSDWKRENGYTFPVHGGTSVDLSPISDYLSLLSEHGIYLNPPDLSVTHHEDYDWIYTEIGKTLYLRYICYFDGSKSSLYLEVPRTYRPKDKALELLIASFLPVDEEEAEKLYQSLQYNVIDEWGIFEAEDYNLAFFEPRYSNGELCSFVSLSVEKTVNQ